MIELIVVSALIALLSAYVLYSAPHYIEKRRDEQRKVDLHNLKVALEDYSNDKTCYPPANILASCNSTTAFSPYMKRVPCDPKTGQAYRYVLASNCLSFQLFTTLEDTTDKEIEAVGCESGCGPGGAYNYGVAGGGALVE